MNVIINKMEFYQYNIVLWYDYYAISRIDIADEFSTIVKRHSRFAVQWDVKQSKYSNKRWINGSAG